MPAMDKIMTRKYVRLRDRNQITLPAEILSGLAVSSGDFLEIGRTTDGLTYIKPAVLTTVGSPEAQREEDLADEDIAHGRFKTFNSVEEFVDHLENHGKPKKKTAEVPAGSAAAAK